MEESFIIVNGKKLGAVLPCSLVTFLKFQGVLQGSVVVELNGDAVAHSEFEGKILYPGDKIELVRIVAGG